MKPWVKLVILAAALAVCIGACFLIVDLANNTEEQHDDPETAVIGKYGSDIVNFTYVYGGVSTEFRLVNYSWVNSSDEDMPLRQDDLDSLAKLIRDGASSVRLVDDSGSLVDSEDFGLSSPALTITASDGSVSQTMYIGAYNSAFSAYYARMEGSGEVYLIDESIPKAFMKDVFELAVSAESYPEYGYQDITRIRLFDGDLEREMTWSEGGSPKLYTDYYTWFEQNASGEYDALRTSAMTVLCENLTAFGDIVCVDYAPDRAALEAYGLAGSERGFDITYIGEVDVENDVGIETQEAEIELEAVFSEADENGVCFMMWTGNDMVYRVSAETADAVLSYVSADLTPDEVCAIQLESVESLKVSYNGAEINVVRTEKSITDANGDTTVTNVFTANGAVVDSTNVNTFYDGLLALKVEGRADAGSWQENMTPYMTVEFSRNTESFSRMTLFVYEYSVNFYRVSFNGEDDILVSIRDIDNMGDAILKTLKN
ncbi:MAG: DUF4340 domain-containing protein [Clostridiales bacterium]|nr:DUF4340 domain-containing protein [Clostridiales bacterium]